MTHASCLLLSRLWCIVLPLLLLLTLGASAGLGSASVDGTAVATVTDEAYIAALSRLEAIAVRQEKAFITKVWQAPLASNAAAAIEWPFDGKTSNRTLLVWCAVRDGKCSYTLLHGPDNLPESSLPKNIHVRNSVSNTNANTNTNTNSTSALHLLVGEDMRLIRQPDSSDVFAIFTRGHHTPGQQSPLKHMFCAKLSYDREADVLFVDRRDLRRVSVEDEFGHRHQKSWTPFFWSNFGLHYRAKPNTTYPHWQLLFAYSLFPEHRIVMPSGNDAEPEEAAVSASPALLAEAQAGPVGEHSHLREGGFRSTYLTLAVTFPNSTLQQPLWSYGEPRGGSQALLVDTGAKAFGKRYLSFFHSSGKVLSGRTQTYFLGAHLFEPDPPFRMTHISIEPLVARPMYNASLGWATRLGQPDFAVFPLSFVDDDVASIGGEKEKGIETGGSITVSWGHNVRASFFLRLDKTAFFASHFRAVQSAT